MKVPESCLRNSILLIWRFTPDIICVLCGLLMTTDGPNGRRIANMSTWWGVPCIVIAFMVVSTLQRGNARNNLSRLFLESQPMNLLGYISYPTCRCLFYLRCALIFPQIYSSVFWLIIMRLCTPMNGEHAVLIRLLFGWSSSLSLSSSLSVGWFRAFFKIFWSRSYTDT